MFLQFEQFVFTTRGPFSEENTLLKLWKAINRYKKTIQTEKRDSLAISIHKAFISDQSRSSVVLPKDLMDCLDPDIPHDRPKTAALKKLQSFAEASLQPLIDFFLDVRGILRGSLSGIERTKLALASKKVIMSSKRALENNYHIHTGM